MNEKKSRAPTRSDRVVAALGSAALVVEGAAMAMIMAGHAGAGVNVAISAAVVLRLAGVVVSVDSVSRRSASAVLAATALKLAFVLDGIGLAVHAFDAAPVAGLAAGAASLVLRLVAEALDGRSG